MYPLQDVKIVCLNKKFNPVFDQIAAAVGENRSAALKLVFGRASGFVLQRSDFAQDSDLIKITPKKLCDYAEGRVFRVHIRGLPFLFEIKGAGLITPRGVLEIDAYGPYETGPPGGLFLEFAKKYFDRGLHIIKQGVKTSDVPLVVIKLPYKYEFKSATEDKIKKRRLAVVGRLVLNPVRVEEFCHALKKIDAAQFCADFGKNLRTLFFDARRTHFALWDGGDVDIAGGIADYDSVHELNPADIADTIDGAITTVKRLLSAAGQTGFDVFFKELTGEKICGTLLERYRETTKMLVAELTGEKAGAALLRPKFNTARHKVYYFSQHAIAQQ